MAAALSCVDASASVVVAAFRSCHLGQQQLQQSSVNFNCSVPQFHSSSRFCQTIASAGSLTKLGSVDTRIYGRTSYLSKPEQTVSTRATPSTDFQAEFIQAVDDAEDFDVHDAGSSGEVISPSVDAPGSDSGLPTQFDDTPRLGVEGADTGKPLSPIAPDPSVDDFPAAPSDIDAPSTSAPAIDSLQSGSGDGLSPQEKYLKLIQGDRPSTDPAQSDAAGDAAGDGFRGVQDTIHSVQSSIDSVRDAAVNSAKGAVDAVRDTADSVVSSVKHTFDSVNGSIEGSVKSATGTFGEGVENAQSGVSDTAQGFAVDLTSVFRVGTPANDSLKEVVVIVKGATSTAFGAAGTLFSQGYALTRSSFPSDLQSSLDTVEGKLSQVSGPVGSAIDKAFIIITSAERALGIDPDNPVIPVILVVGGSLTLGFAYFKSRYGGYSGDLRPSAALEVLKKEKNAVLVDIRPQEAREAEGIPDFRRSFRSKFCAVEIPKVEGPIRGMLNNVSNVEVLLTAAIIRNLRSVERKSKVIVLDSDGGKSKQIARGLRRSGLKRAYLVDGGYKAWASSGLRCKADQPQTALAILQEDAEAIVEEVNPTPFGVFGVLVGIVAGAYAVYEWEKTLQFIALLGLAVTCYTRLGSYESIEDAKADLSLLQKPFKVAGEKILWVVRLVEPKKIQLATSPASSNVQGKVIQAAAKHGPISPDLELVEDESTPSQTVEEDSSEGKQEEAVEAADEGDGDAEVKESNNPNQSTGTQESQ